MLYTIVVTILFQVATLDDVEDDSGKTGLSFLETPAALSSKVLYIHTDSKQQCSTQNNLALKL